jgi:hypothetical protein
MESIKVSEPENKAEPASSLILMFAITKYLLFPKNIVLFLSVRSQISDRLIIKSIILVNQAF